MGCCGNLNRNIIASKVTKSAPKAVNIRPMNVPVQKKQKPVAKVEVQSVKPEAPQEIVMVSNSILKHKCPVCRSKVREITQSSEGRKRGRCTNMTCQFIFYLS